MIAGDYIDSRSAAIRHELPSCGADVAHDELQVLLPSGWGGMG